MPHILSRYILRETVGTWLGVTGALLVILLTNQVATVLARAAEQGFPRGVVIELVGFGVLTNLAVLLPIGLLLGVVVAFGRLYHDSEMTAVLACGVDRWRIHAPVILLAIVVSSIVAWLTLFGAPAASARVEALRASALQAGEFAPIAPGRFRSFGGGSVVLYAGAAGPDGLLERVFVKRVRDDRYEIAIAARARHSVSADGELHTLTLFEGERYEGVPGSSEFRIVRFATNVIPVRVPPLGARAGELDAVPTSTLMGSGDLALRAELHWRMATPLMVFVLAMLAVPISRLRPRQGRYSRLWLATVVYFVYFSMVSAAKVWMAKGVVPAVLGLWWVHVAVAVLTLSLIVIPDLRARLRHRHTPALAGAH
ncbi:MAG: LPS export ABC transporter permease LptF [Gammaproteobacteria bacterium]